MRFLTSKIWMDSRMNISQGTWSYNRSSLSSLLWKRRHRLLRWVPPKANPETRMCVQMVYLGGNRKHQQGSRQRSKVASNKRGTTGQIPLGSNWGSILLGSSGRQYRRCLRYPNRGARTPGYLSSSLLHSLVESYFWKMKTPGSCGLPASRCKRKVLRQLLTAGSPFRWSAWEWCS